jgi:hypothetical protein
MGRAELWALAGSASAWSQSPKERPSRATSGATAHVERVIVQDGEWGAATRCRPGSRLSSFSRGRSGRSGERGHQSRSDELRHQQPRWGFHPALPPGGRYDCKVKNFYGAVNRKRVYVVNGVGTWPSNMTAARSWCRSSPACRRYTDARLRHRQRARPGASQAARFKSQSRASRACSTRSSARSR